MTKINVLNIGKKYKNDWIFRNLTLELNSNQKIAVVGPNGSGKSTFMQALAGMIPLNEGNIEYLQNSNLIDEDNWQEYLSFSAPYLELIEAFTLTEALDFHQKFKPFQNNLSTPELIEILNFESHTHKNLKFFSSGMIQKLKLLLAFYSESSVLFLDEPTANLDKSGFDWYLNQIESQTVNKIVLISSNLEKEYDFCKQQLNILDFK